MKIVKGGPLRVFISYAAPDREFAARLVQIVKGNGLLPLWDQMLPGACRFAEEIKFLIASSHVFVPLVTPASSKRRWVQQEIGYAVAHGLPVIPIARGNPPAAMLEGLQSVNWTNSEVELRRTLSGRSIHKLLEDPLPSTRPVFECAKTNEERLRMLAEYARHIKRVGFSGMVRQRATLGFLSIPDKPPEHRLFLERFGGAAAYASEARNTLLRAMRHAMEDHARNQGCRLLLDPYYGFEEFDVATRISRLGVLLESLEGMQVIDGLEDVAVVLTPSLPGAEHFISVGDWFVAESMTYDERRGYRYTVFTRHAPTVRDRIEQFDEEFLERLESQRLTPRESREAAIEEIARILSKLKRRRGRGTYRVPTLVRSGDRML